MKNRNRTDNLQMDRGHVRWGLAVQVVETVQNLSAPLLNDLQFHRRLLADVLLDGARCDNLSDKDDLHHTEKKDRKTQGGKEQSM